jgi:putative oxidoreductase
VGDSASPGEQLCHRPGAAIWAALAARLTQIGAGLLLVVGLATPLAAAGLIGVMTIATTVKLHVGFSSQDGGFEYPSLLAFLAVVVAWTRPGDWSLNGLPGLTPYWTDWVGAAATGVGVGAALGMRLVLHRPDMTAAALVDGSDVQ